MCLLDCRHLLVPPPCERLYSLAMSNVDGLQKPLGPQSHVQVSSPLPPRLPDTRLCSFCNDTMLEHTMSRAWASGHVLCDEKRSRVVEACAWGQRKLARWEHYTSITPVITKPTNPEKWADTKRTHRKVGWSRTRHETNNHMMYTGHWHPSRPLQANPFLETTLTSNDTTSPN